jgi:hypothetical protein
VAATNSITTQTVLNPALITITSKASNSKSYYTTIEAAMSSQSKTTSFFTELTS